MVPLRNTVYRRSFMETTAAGLSLSAATLEFERYTPSLVLTSERAAERLSFRQWSMEADAKGTEGSKVGSGQ
jgi:hypothetical protein